jgi:hypothetical protein
MTQSNPSDDSDHEEAKLSRRDWILFPALTFLTIGLLLVSADSVARWKFATLSGVGEDCLVFTDPSTGVIGIPNSVCQEKIPEGEVSEYRFNTCGHRTDLECEVKPPGAYRIVMIGGSYAMGMRVPLEKSFAALLPAELSQRTGRTVELYNEGMPWRPPQIIARHFNNVLAPKPDMILWVIVPLDIWNPLWTLRYAGTARSPGAPQALSAYDKVKRILRAASNRVNHVATKLSAPTELMLRHFLYKSQSYSITSYLQGSVAAELPDKPDAPYMRKVRGPDFLKVAPSEDWQNHLRAFDADAANIEAQARAAGVPLVAVLLPERTQAAMLSRGECPAGFDPYKLDSELRSIIESHGGTYIDILRYFRGIPNTEQGFYPLDGHPDASGHAMISGLIAKELMNDAAPALRVAAPRNAVLEQSR